MQRRPPPLALAPSATAGLGLLLAALASSCGEHEELVGSRPHEMSLPGFTSPKPVSELNDPSATDEDATLTADGLEIYFMTMRRGAKEIWSSRRASLDEPWDPPEPVAELDLAASEITPAISADGLRMWLYCGDEPPGLWSTSRSSREDPWQRPEPIAELESEDLAIGPSLDATETELVFAWLRTGGDFWDLYRSEREDAQSAWGTPQALTTLNTETAEHDPFLFDGGRQLLFSSTRTGKGDLYWSSTPEPGGVFASPEALLDLNTADYIEADPHLSADGSTLYYSSTATGGGDIYEAHRVRD